jgi:hypothetical protein
MGLSPRRRGRSLSLSVALGVAVCGGAEEQSMPESAPASTPAVERTLTIVAPVDGAFQEEHEVTVLLNSTVSIVPAGDMTPGTGHHHLYLDADLGDMSAPVPTVPGSIVHIGNAAREYVFENVPSGPHRLIAVVADGAHIALQPLVVDTVDFVIE